jgi:biopolymer transport protein TolR
MQRKRQALSEINVTPFVDVMLVLLIIFMVTAPLMQQGVDVELPQAEGQKMSPAERVNITIAKDGRIYMDKSSVTLDTLKARLSGENEKEVFLRADKEVPYGRVVIVMGALKEMGVEKLGMVTEPTARF